MRLSAVVSVGLLVAACSSTGGGIGVTGEDAGGDDSQSDATPGDDGPAESAVPEAATCDRHFPPCPATPPSYQTQVAAIIHSTCVTCHYPGSNLTRTSYETYQGVYGDRGSILGQVYACNMPPANAPLAITQAQRETLLEWLDCGAPNN